MKDDQLLRYSRQIMLPQVDIAGQQALLDSHVLIIGAGGLGSPASMYLAAAGVGKLTLVDNDTVELSNLQRQLAHAETDLGANKVDSAAATLRAINSDVEVVALNRRVGAAELGELVSSADVVLDATDNVETRFAINRACLAAKVPLVSGAAIRLEGQVAVFDSRQSDSPCYECLYKVRRGRRSHLRGQWGVCASGGHNRVDASTRSTQTDRAVWRYPRWQVATLRCVKHAMA